jgi:hypothetical protein
MPLRASRLPTGRILLPALPAMFTTLTTLALTALVLLLSTTLTAFATALTLATTLSLVLLPAIALTGFTPLALTLTLVSWVAFLLCLFLVPCHSYLPLIIYCSTDSGCALFAAVNRFALFCACEDPFLECLNASQLTEERDEILLA